jgi:hypothetical protein
MNTEDTQMQLFAHALRELALRHPGLFFEDRKNPEHVAAYDEYNEAGTKMTRKAKPCALEFARFQAWRGVTEKVELPALRRKQVRENKETGKMEYTGKMETYRDEVKATVTFRRLVAWASNPRRLAEILEEKGVTK